MSVKPTGTQIQGAAGMATPFEIERSFESDIRTVFEMWVNPELYIKWLGPAGADMSFTKADVSEGSSSQWSMTTADGNTKHGKLNYQKISPPELFVYTQNFCDKDGNLTKPFFSATYPDTLLTTVALNQDGPSRTRVTVKWEVFGEATEAEYRTFHEMKPAMTGGWGESFDKLETMLRLSKKP